MTQVSDDASMRSNLVMSDTGLVSGLSHDGDKRWRWCSFCCWRRRRNKDEDNDLSSTLLDEENNNAQAEKIQHKDDVSDTWNQNKLYF
jgi:hypothetical protein